MSMPKIPVLTVHTIFPFEIDRSAIALTSQRVWEVDGSGSLNRNQQKISKPRGEVMELQKGGYSLQRVLQWEENKYQDIQVKLLLDYLIQY